MDLTVLDVKPYTGDTTAPAGGFVRLFRGEPPISDASRHNGIGAHTDDGATGGWFTTQLEFATFFSFQFIWDYQRRSPSKAGRVVFMDLPAEVAESHRLEKFPELFKGREFERGLTYFFPELRGSK